MSDLSIMWWEQGAHMPLNQLQSISTQSYANSWLFLSVDTIWFDDLQDISHPCESFISPGHACKLQIFIGIMFQLCLSSREAQQVLLSLTWFIDQYTNPRFETIVFN